MKKSLFLLNPMAVVFLGLSVMMTAQIAFAGGNLTNSTAQSVMFDTTTNGTFLMTDTQVYEYDRGRATAYFTNAWDGVVPVGQVQGQAHGTTAPTAPTAPDPIPSFLQGSVNSNSCVFWTGGQLDEKGHVTYSQGVTINDVPYSYCSKYSNTPPYQCTKLVTGYDTYKFTYNYNVTANGDGSVPGVMHMTDPDLYPWKLTGSTPGGPITVTLSGNIAAETTVKKSKGNDPWTFKTAFNLPNAIDPLTGQYIGLQNIIATLTDSTGAQLAQQTLSNTVQKGVDFYYYQNAGYNGPMAQLVDKAWVSAIETGGAVANDGMTRDDFAGNNASLGDLAALTPTDFTINAPGDYTLTITGSLQGVAGALPLNFSVTQSVIYEAAENACPAITR
jgi:hypothetical protein